MARPDSEYRELLPQGCNLLEKAKKDLKNNKYECGRVCSECPVVKKDVVIPPVTFVQQPTGNQFIDRDFDIRTIVVYSAELPPYQPEDTSRIDAILRLPIFDGLEILKSEE